MREWSGRRVPLSVLEALRRLPDVTSTVSDVLDDLGFQLAVSGSMLVRRTPAVPVMVGHAITLLYHPARHQQRETSHRSAPPKLAHLTAFAMARPGDVLVISVPGVHDVSVFGELAAARATTKGLSGCVVDGGVRDIAEVQQSGIGVWSRSVTPKTGKWRLEAAGLNVPIVCGSVQVLPGDLVVADDTGLCFVPESVADPVIARVREVCASEAAELSGR